MMLGLRLSSGVDLAAFADRFGDDSIVSRRNTIDGLQAAGLVEVSDGWLRLTPGAVMVANEVVCRLL